MAYVRRRPNKFGIKGGSNTIKGLHDYLGSTLSQSKARILLKVFLALNPAKLEGRQLRAWAEARITTLVRALLRATLNRFKENKKPPLDCSNS